MPYLALIHNASLLLALTYLFSLLRRWKPLQKNWSAPLLQGLVFGLVAVLVMLTPMTLEDGLIFDTRSVVLAAAGLFGGPLAAFLALLPPLIYRMSLGGVGVWMGSAVIVGAAGLGLAWRSLSRRWPCLQKPAGLYALGLVVHLYMLGMMAFLPQGMGRAVLENLALPILVIYPLVSLLLFLLLQSMEQQSQAAQELAASRHELASILDNSPALIYLKDPQGRYIFVNRRYTQTTGLSLAQTRGRSDLELFPEPTARAFQANDQRALGLAEAVDVEELLPQADGLHQYRSLKVALRNPEGQVYALCGISTDITDQKRLESQLQQAQKMETVGRLAGGIAHDFNNMLSVILGYAQLALTQVPPSDPLRKSLTAIETAARRSEGITRQLLAFSRKQVLEPRDLDLNFLVNESLEALGRMIGEDIELSFDPGPEPLILRSDPAHLTQILFNLAVNARDAMPEGGRLSLRTRREVLASGPYVVLEVEDTGVGMDPQTLDRIFEPFFTTKDVGRGTGLGLSTVYGIVTQNRGQVQVQSAQGQGTTFRVLLPALGNDAAPSASEPARDETPPSPGGKTQGLVLLVEDDALVRGMTQGLLESLGFHVVPTGGVTEALQRLKERLPEWTFVLSDVVMPGLRGPELARALQQLRPDLPLLFMSGYTDDLSLDPLLKPFSRTQLAARIEKLLSSATPPR